ncbi:LysR family transcriptional regulator [Yinghuangia sp. ASG 101]|uniref:LysR family transcriptional regulator n=1 Tax=Yinghuangia sp. ASG 101 TaxID=2896848 RepID=UPI001E4E9C39|nr:LysR family transcriptional regulator [Yinghuangia sp. ASG 101]UGQ11529.1 LysR family transcriptional regulator [Yinghuangia sp. ASG 101]
MERDELDCFLILAEELHFGRTAERMRLSRSRVSQLINRLERRIGAPLFARTSRRVGLTAIGRQLRDDLSPLHSAMQAAVRRARTSARGIDTVLHVGFATPPIAEMALEAAEVLRTTHPELAVEICEVPFADPFGSLRSGEFDVQITELPLGEPDLGHGPPLVSEGRVLAVPAGHPLAARTEVTFEDLAAVSLLTAAGDVPAPWREHRAPTRTPSGRAIARGPVVTNMQEALTMVGAGKGALLAPAHAGSYFARPGIAFVPFADAAPVAYGMVWRAAEITDAIRLFAETTAQVARQPTTSP